MLSDILKGFTENLQRMLPALAVPATHSIDILQGSRMPYGSDWMQLLVCLCHLQLISSLLRIELPFPWFFWLAPRFQSHDLPQDLATLWAATNANRDLLTGTSPIKYWPVCTGSIAPLGQLLPLLPSHVQRSLSSDRNYLAICWPAYAGSSCFPRPVAPCMHRPVNKEVPVRRQVPLCMCQLTHAGAEPFCSDRPALRGGTTYELDKGQCLWVFVPDALPLAQPSSGVVNYGNPS